MYSNIVSYHRNAATHSYKRAARKMKVKFEPGWRFTNIPVNRWFSCCRVWTIDDLKKARDFTFLI